MNAINANPEQLASYAEITREYARFSRSAAGLGNVIGGGLALLSWAVWSYVPDSILRRVVLIVLPVLWIAIKKWLRRRYYQRYGQVTSRGDRRGKFWKVGLTALLALVSWGVVAAFIILGLRGPHHQPLVPARLLRRRNLPTQPSSLPAPSKLELVLAKIISARSNHPALVPHLLGWQTNVRANACESRHGGET